MSLKRILLRKITRIVIVSIVAITIGYVAKSAGIGSGIGAAVGVVNIIYEAIISIKLKEV